jgi:SAM-dependent methyltransferase
MAAAYAARWFGVRLVQEMARFARCLNPGARVLDVGCGPGQDVAWLAEQGFDPVGVDLSSAMLFEGRNRGIDLPLIRADMRDLPFRSGSFAGIWASASLLHLPKMEVGEVLRELARIVCPGHVYLAVKRGRGATWVEDKGGQRRFFSYYAPAEIRRLVEHAGFEVLSCWESEDLAGRERSWINVLAQCGIRAPIRI